MSDDHKDVLIAAYMFEDFAKRDFEALLKLAEEKTITVEGVVLVQKDAQGEVTVTETGDHLGKNDQPIVAAKTVHRLEDIAIHNTDLKRFAIGLRTNDVGELRTHLHRIHRVATPRQRQGIAPGSSADDCSRRSSVRVGRAAELCHPRPTAQRRAAP